MLRAGLLPQMDRGESGSGPAFKVTWNQRNGYTFHFESLFESTNLRLKIC